jgi:hypothetical protein
MYDPRSDLTRYDQDKPRTLQQSVGPSSTGGCRRQHAYRWHQTPPDPGATRSEAAARYGTLLHMGWSVMIRRLGEPGREPDVRIEIPGLPAPGYADDVDWAAAVVTDLKTTSGRAYASWCTYGVPERFWDQVEVYAYGLRRRARLPWTLRIVLFNRETGDEQPFERPADPAYGEHLAAQLVAEQARLEASDSPYEFPRDGAGPGRGMPCDWCSWLRQCWGPGRDGMSAQASTVVDDPAEVAARARDYLAAGAEARKFKRAQDDARAFLEGLPAGQYEDVVLGWSGGNPRPPGPDPDAMAETLEWLGIPTPLREGGRTNRTIRVTKVPGTIAGPAANDGPHDSRPARVEEAPPEGGEHQGTREEAL